MGAKEFKWPEYDESMLKENIINIVIQINGKKEELLKLKEILMKKIYLNLFLKMKK